MAENTALNLPAGVTLDKEKDDTPPEGVTLDTKTDDALPAGVTLDKPTTKTETLPKGVTPDRLEKVGISKGALSRYPEKIQTRIHGIENRLSTGQITEDRAKKELGIITKHTPRGTKIQIAADRLAAFTAPLKITPLAGIANVAQAGSEIFGTPKEVSSGAATAAAFATGTIGMAESIFRTPETLLRFTRFAHKKFAPKGIDFEGSGQNKAMEWVAKYSNQLADSIKSAREMLAGPILGDTVIGKPFAEVAKLNQRADVATNKLFEGDFRPLVDLLGDTRTWGAFVGQAGPSMIAAIMSGGSLKFISWLEGMEFASDANDFEKRTGIKISDEEFVKGLGQTAFINGLLERFGIRKITKGAGREAVRKFLNSSIGKKVWTMISNGLRKGLWESGTEVSQQVNTNIAEFIQVQGKKLEDITLADVSKGVLASGIGGFGAGVGVSGATDVTQIGPAPTKTTKKAAPEVVKTKEQVDKKAQNDAGKSQITLPEVAKTTVKGGKQTQIETSTMREVFAKDKETTATLSDISLNTTIVANENLDGMAQTTVVDGKPVIEVNAKAIAAEAKRTQTPVRELASAVLLDQVRKVETAGVPQRAKTFTKTEALPAERIKSTKEITRTLTQDKIDLADELIDNKAVINNRGDVTLYHRTTDENAKQIIETGKITGEEDGVFFSTTESGQAEGFGKAIIQFKIPIDQIEIDDAFGNEAHVRIPLKKAGQKFDISPFLVERTTPTTNIQEENIDPKTIQEARKIIDEELKGAETETKTGTGTLYSGIPIEAVNHAANKALDNLQDNLGIPIEGVVVPKGEEKGVGPGPNVLRSPNRVSEKFPVFKKYFGWAREAFNVQERLRALFNKRENAIDKILGGNLLQRKIPVLNKKFKDNWQEFEGLSWAADLIGRDFTDSELRSDGVAEEVILALKLQRTGFDSAIKISNKVRELRQKDEIHRRGGYIPHFFHNFFLNGKDGVITSARTLKEAVKLANQAARIGEKVTITQKMFSFPGEEVQASVMGDMSFFKLKNSVEKSFELTAEEATEVLKGIARMKGRSRFIGNFLQRKGVKGFEKDLRWVKRHYFNMIARYVAMDQFKQKAITAFNREGFGDFDKQQKGIASHVKNYINDILGVPTRVEELLNHFLDTTPVIKNITGKFLGGRPALQIASTITSAVSIVKLGLGNISAAVINMSQYNLKQSVLGPKYNLVGDWRSAKVIKELAKRKLLTKGTFLIPNDIAFDLGVLRASNVFTQLGLEAGAGYSSAGLLGPLFKSSMVLFQSVEVYLRISTTLGAYYKTINEIAKREGITKNEAKKNKDFHKEALKISEETNFFVNFDYSIVDAPSILRRTGPVGQVQFQFKKFPIKMTESIINMKAAQHARFWIPLFLMAGLYAIPGWDLFNDILKKLSKLWGEEFDMELELKLALTNWAGKDKWKRAIAKTIMYGVFSNEELGGISIGRRVGVGDFIPTRLEDVFTGPFFSSDIRAIQMASQREWIETLRAIATAPGNIAKAISNEGEVLSPWDRNRPVAKLGTKGRIFKGMGFRTAAEAMESDQARIINYQTRNLKKMRTRAVDLIVLAAIAQDKGDIKLAKTLEDRATKLIERNDIMFTEKMVENEIVAKSLTRGQRAAFRTMKNGILLGRISGSLEFFEAEREARQ